MKFVDEYRNAQRVQQIVTAIAQITTGSWTIMEICGGQTHTIVKYGLDTLLPRDVTLIHGPGCPVCVTPSTIIDQAIALAMLPEVIFCSFGDMLRVPGSTNATLPDLLSAKAAGGDIRMVYSPLDAVNLAQQHPDRQVIFFAIGFETTAPATAMAVYQAAQANLENFSLLVSHVLVPPAMATILASPNAQVQGFLAAGHVCTVMGYQAYHEIAQTYHIPIVVTGFEPLDLLQGIYACVQQLENGQARVDNQYARSVQPQGNEVAQRLMAEVFEITAQEWRGLGTIAASGLRLRNRYQQFDALHQFSLKPMLVAYDEVTECMSGKILQGLCKPWDCPAFGDRCTPDHPLGAPMVSAEGACAAYYHYR
jgi:hydrogenase expression/formation protein HypD